MATATRKRKRLPSGPSASTPTNTLAVFATQLKQNPDKPSLLLDLPPELRNIIYTLVLDDAKVQLSSNTKKRALAVESAMPRVNKQVRDEFMSVAWLSADIHTIVLDFDFRHIVTFLNRLSDAELKALPSIATPTERKIIIDLIISDECEERPPLFNRWINRAGHPTKKGTHVDMQYNVAGGVTHCVDYALRRGKTPRFPAWKPWFERLEEGRQKQELGKVTAALKY